MGELLFKTETYRIIGRCMEVHKQLGSGFAENIYKDALQMEFGLQHIDFEREKPFCVVYKGAELPHRYFADFVVFGKIILEVKAVAALSPAHVAQTINYLKASGCKIGLLINFSAERLEYQRLIV